MYKLNLFLTVKLYCLFHGFERLSYNYKNFKFVVRYREIGSMFVSVFYKIIVYTSRKLWQKKTKKKNN